MRSKNSKSHTPEESAHLYRVKLLQCSVCDAAPPSAAHHIVQGDHFTTVALCYECHQGHHGLHGTKVLWSLKKMTEMKALNITLGRLNRGNKNAY